VSKTTWWIIGVIVVIGLIVIIWGRMKGGAGPAEQPSPTAAIPGPAPVTPALSTLSFSVEGLTTEDAKTKVEGAVKGVTGVSKVASNLATSTLTVEYDPAAVTDVEAFKAEITKAIEGAGFKVKTEAPAETTPAGK